MNSAVSVFWGSEIDVQSERDFLRRLKADLEARGIAAIILANFYTNSGSRQVDFLVATEDHVCHVELKNYTGIVYGSTNGPWSVRRDDGTLEPIDRPNPYAQALYCKYAISDDMSALTDADQSIPRIPGVKFYKQIDSVVCIYPEPRAGSTFRCPDRVHILGYNDFSAFLTSEGPTPRWRPEHWEAFILRLSLMPADKPSSRPVPRSRARELTAAYRLRFDDYYQHDLHELVPLPLEHDGDLMPADLSEAVQASRHTQLVGPSGSGKSHLARHTTLRLGASMLPILIEVGQYEGRLSTSIGRSVARFTTSSTREVFDAASINGQVVLLLLDGYNECPERLRDRLAGDLHAFCLATKSCTLITSQRPVGLAGDLIGAVVTVGTLSNDDRQAILNSYGAADILPLCEPFTTAYELSIAAECAQELAAPLTRGALFAAFVRKRLSQTPSPALVRRTLRQLAEEMNDRLTTWLPLDDVWRISEEYLDRQAESPNVVDELLRCSIVRSEHGKFAFTHELLGRFLVVEALRQRHPVPSALAQQLRLPRHDDLSRMAVELEYNASRADGLLAGLADWVLYFWAFHGEVGQAAQRATRLAAKHLLAEVTSGMTETVFTVPDNLTLTVTGGRQLASADRALLAAVGALVREGEFAEEVLSLLDATDEACQRSADIQERQTGQRPSATECVSAVLTGATETARHAVAAAVVLSACEHGLFDSRLWSRNTASTVSIEGLTLTLAGASPTSYGRLLLLTRCLRHAEGLDAAAIALRVLRLCSEGDAYHVRLDALWMMQAFARTVQGHALHDEIVNVLDGLDTGNVMLNSSLVETWDAYGMVEAPDEANEIRARIEEVLGWPQTEDSCRLAYGIVSSQFEGVACAEYLEAVEALRPEQRTILHTRAALGSDTHGAWSDLILGRLLGYDDPLALPAFERWATELDTTNIVVHEIADCFVLGVLGCSKFMDQPPPLVNNRSPERAAWECYGAIIFWMSRLGLQSAEVSEHCAKYWQRLQTELLSGAADPLYWLKQTSIVCSDRAVSAVGAILTTFRDEARPILDWSLDHREALLSIFPAVRTAGPERQGFVIRMLGVVGTAETAEKLRGFVDDPYLGSSAISAIKRLTGA